MHNCREGKMRIQRDRYLQKLIDRRDNGMVKVITGIRRCGKSYLLHNIYKEYLLEQGVAEDHILTYELDLAKDIRYRDPLELAKTVRNRVEGLQEQFYLFIDEIQMSDEVPNPYNPNGKSITFYDALNDLNSLPNLDIYVTGSNSRMLSTDILTEFRGRGDEIRVNPLSYKEFYSAYAEDKRNAWRDYVTYGGMPQILSQKSSTDKSRFLHTLFDKIYLDDIMSRNNIANEKSVLDDLLDIVSSSVGSLTNPSKIQKTFASAKGTAIADDTISRYLDYFGDAFLLYQAKRYDVKGRKYIGSPLKYYFSDIGLRNVRLNFRQQEENHIMENIIYNELRVRDFDVDVGVVTFNTRDEYGKSKRIQHEVDFVANRGSQRFYIQSAFAIPDEQNRRQETASLAGIGDSFRKIVVVRENIAAWHDEKGILYIGVEDFLLDEDSINK